MIVFIRRYPLLSFFIISCVISWSFLYPCYQLILNSEEIPPLAFIGIIGAYGPSIAAIIVQRVLDKSQLRALLNKIIMIRTSIWIVLFIIIVPILLYLLSYTFTASVFDGDLSINWKQGITSIPFWVLVALPFGPMGEELGWRGFMLPKLLEKFSVLKSTAIVGLAWGIWHLASFSFPGAAIPEFLPVSIWTISLFCLNTISLSLIYTYVFFKTKGSVFYAILLHAFFNAASNITFEFFARTDDFNILMGSYCFNIVLAGLLGYALLREKTIAKGA